MTVTRRLDIPSAGAVLEGVAHLPDGNPFGAVVVCHPHPLYGGDMDNHVVLALCEAAVEAGLAALRFNFRGTGRSTGSHDQGRAEQEDVLAALSQASALLGPHGGRLGVVGYSFGAVMAALAAPRAQGVAALVLVSPPARALSAESLTAFPGPKLVLAGDMDQFAPAQVLQQLALEAGENCELALVPGVDHFWWSSLRPAAARVAAFLRKHLAQQPPRG
jgi:alpha/beta superfamily hydrolase